MNNQQILDNAPEGTTHVDRANHYWKFIGEFDDFLMCDREGGWIDGFSPIVTRSLADIKRIAELEKTNTFLQEDLNALVAKHGSLHTKFTELEQGE